MKYIVIDVTLPRHPKVIGLSSDAFRTLICFWCYCHEYLTDGHVPVSVWQQNGRASSRRQLLDAGLAHETADGYIMHDYLQYQQSRHDADTKTKKHREAGLKGAVARWGLRQEPSQPPSPEPSGTARQPPSQHNRTQQPSTSPLANATARSPTPVPPPYKHRPQRPGQEQINTRGAALARDAISPNEKP